MVKARGYVYIAWYHFESASFTSFNFKLIKSVEIDNQIMSRELTAYFHLRNYTNRRVESKIMVAAFTFDWKTGSMFGDGYMDNFVQHFNDTF